MSYTQEDILAYLDDIEKDGLTRIKSKLRPMSEDLHNLLEEALQGRIANFLNTPCAYTSGSRITLFADESRWAIALEKTGFDIMSQGIELEMRYFGNCVEKEFSSVQLAYPDDLLYAWLIFEDYVYVKVRDKDIPIKHDTAKYAEKRIDVPKGILDLSSVARYMDETNHELFRATEAELREGLPSDLPILMRIDHWYQKPVEWISAGDDPKKMIVAPLSSYETYRMIADVLVTKDTSKWQPTLASNNNWRNWPDAERYLGYDPFKR